MTSKLVEKCREKNVSPLKEFEAMLHFLTEESKNELLAFIEKYTLELKEKTLKIIKSDIFEGSGIIKVEKDFIKVEKHLRIETLESWTKLITVDVADAVDEIVVLLTPPLNFWISCDAFKRDFTPDAVQDLISLIIKNKLFRSLDYAEVGYKCAHTDNWAYDFTFEF